jgi:streptogramin lyase
MPSNDCHRLGFAFAVIPFVTTLAHAEPVCRSFARAGIPGDAAISALPDGTVWYANRSGNRLTRVNPDQTLTRAVSCIAVSC